MLRLLSNPPSITIFRLLVFSIGQIFQKSTIGLISTNSVSICSYLILVHPFLLERFRLGLQMRRWDLVWSWPKVSQTYPFSTLRHAAIIRSPLFPVVAQDIGDHSHRPIWHRSFGIYSSSC